MTRYVFLTGRKHHAGTGDWWLGGSMFNTAQLGCSKVDGAESEATSSLNSRGMTAGSGRRDGGVLLREFSETQNHPARKDVG